MRRSPYALFQPPLLLIPIIVLLIFLNIVLSYVGQTHQHAQAALLPPITWIPSKNDPAILASCGCPVPTATPTPAPTATSVPVPSPYVITGLPFNNEGISADSNTVVADFDGGAGGHNSYSQSQLSVSGINSGQTFTTGGISFQWPTIGVGVNDNVQVSGQTIAINVANGRMVRILGSSTNGPSYGTATLTYTDGSTASFVLDFTDWALHGDPATTLEAGNSAVASMTYRNIQPSGTQALPMRVFEATYTLDTTKTLQSITLPGSVNTGTIHIFAMTISF